MAQEPGDEHVAEPAEEATGENTAAFQRFYAGADGADTSHPRRAGRGLLGRLLGGLRARR